jgi:hypothetical protein
VARETKFTQRRSNMTASLVVKTMVFGLLEKATASLNDLTAFCEEHFGIRLSPQGLDERIHQATWSFRQRMFPLALVAFCQTVRLPVPLLTQFSAGTITDSTGISLPASVAEEFPGSGGDASPAGFKLQLVLEFLTGGFKTIPLTDGITPDQKVPQHIGLAAPGSLNLLALGYVVGQHLKAFTDKGAYFLCRLLSGIGLYGEDGKPLNLAQGLPAEWRDCVALEVRRGADVQLPCRRWCFRVTKEVAHRRRPKANQPAAKKGRPPTRTSLELLGWTVFITHVPAGMLALDQIRLLSALRWQIERIFKLWKSHRQLHLVSGYRKERILVDLYAKLIGLGLLQWLAMPLRAKDLNLRPIKALKRFIKHSGALAEALRSLKSVIRGIEHLHTALRKFAKREKRPPRFTPCQQLFLEVVHSA